MGVKTGGLLHLFDWNRKSRKKLFPSGNISPEGTKEGTMTNNEEQTSHSCLIEDDDGTRGLSSGRGNSDYSCASSVTDEESNGNRVPGVVARLMGLDSLPTVDISEPYSTPLFNSRPLQENCYQKRGPEFNTDDHFSNLGVRSDCYTRRPLELRSQKMPSSPIERFQTEVLPPRSAKFLPTTHYKLLSPIKNPSFISGKNAAHIMEAAAKILEPGLQANAKSKAPSASPSSLALEVREPDERITVFQSLSRLPESSRRPVESIAIKYLKGYLTNKSWNALEDSISVRASPEWGERNFTGAKDKGKTISLAIQAKVNVQRREGSSTSSGSPSVQQEQDEAKLNWSFKSQPSSKKMLQKNASTFGPHGVLKQNNQKQNRHVNKEKLSAKSSMPNQQKKKVPSGDANYGKNRILNKIQVSAKNGYRKELQATDLEDSSSSTTKNVPRKKRLIDRSYQSKKKSSTSTILVGSHMRHVQPSVMIDEHQKWGGDGRANGANIVSFTFTSPMIKPTLRSQSTYIMERHDMSSSSVAMDGERNDAVAKNSNLPSLGLNMITGDALSVLLEQKLRELTSGLESSSNIGEMGNRSVSALNPHLISDSGNTHIVSIEFQRETTRGPCKTSLCDVSDNSLSVNGALFNLCTGMQGVESLTECCSSGSDVHKEFEQQYPSPLSILEASFSSDSCSSSDSSDGYNGNKISSAVGAQTYASFSENEASGEAEMDVSDSASSICVETICGEPALGISSCHEISKEEMEYLKDIFQNAGIDFQGMASGCLNHSLDPLLFDLLENKRFSFRNRAEDKNHRQWRKVLFDFVDECLESKHSHYFKAGFRTWAKGSFMIGRFDKFADEIFKAISGWKRMGDWMVDEVVDKDMSSHVGRWVDIEAEAFEAGVEIEKVLVNCLIDEIVADFVM